MSLLNGCSTLKDETPYIYYELKDAAIRIRDVAATTAGGYCIPGETCSAHTEPTLHDDTGLKER